MHACHSIQTSILKEIKHFDENSWTETSCFADVRTFQKDILLLIIHFALKVILSFLDSFPTDKEDRGVLREGKG